MLAQNIKSRPVNIYRPAFWYGSLWSQGGAASNTGGHHRPVIVSIPLKSGRCCKCQMDGCCEDCVSLNPFEVREVLQVFGVVQQKDMISLNPFEVREVLQVRILARDTPCASQSLWSQGGAARRRGHRSVRPIWSQSLWSQGGAASHMNHVMIVLVCLNPFEVREVLQVKQFV